MKIVKSVLLLLPALVLAGCVTFSAENIKQGMTEQEVVAKVGKPAGRYQDGNTQLLEYPQGPWAQTTHMVRLGADGRVVSWEQVLTVEKFATIKVNEATKADVLRTIGRPAETSYLHLPKLEVWSYRYKEGGVWDSMMHVHFDRSGVVRMMQNGRDPMYDDSERSRGGGRR
ncbi:MAG: hypothetical protein VB032_05360 [Burkholderiaceae bacterium]|nr:hypothetical protein [Burkholderiaceae bacterium]